MDLKSGYWQVKLDDESIPLLAFTVGPLGFYKCVQMLFGLMNAPASFQCLMESCLGEMYLNWCIIYLDDVIIFSRTQMNILKERCFPEIEKMDPKKIQVILDWPRPQTVYHVRSFLGFTNTYRKFMYKYSQIARPLNDLISGENAKKKTAPVKWGPEQQNVFDKLKGLCSQAPILAYTDYKKPF